MLAARSIDGERPAGRGRDPRRRNRLARARAATAVAAASVVLALAAAPSASADVDDFTFSSYSSDITLDVDANGRSVVTTVETLVAEFPETDQNRGIQRALPEEYEGAPTDLTLESVTDETGAERPVDTDSDDGFLIVTSAGDDYVHGSQSYVLTYTEKNLTLPASKTDSGLDEFFRDTNGTAWRQPFDRVEARLHVPTALADRLTGDTACYQGPAGSTERCEITRVDGADETVFTASATDLAAGENVSIAVAFEPDTFVPRDDSYFASAWGPIQLGGVALGLLALVWAIVSRRTILRQAPGRPTIIAEYAPPADGVFPAAGVSGALAKAATATFVDLAVRGVLEIVELDAEAVGDASGSDGSTSAADRRRAKKAAKKKVGAAGYVLRLVDPTGTASAGRRFARPRPLTAEETEFLTLIFGADARPGAERHLGDEDPAFGTAVQKFLASRPAALRTEGYRRNGTTRRSVAVSAVALLALLAAVVAGCVQIASALGGFLPGILLGVAVLLFVGALILVARVPLTAKGAELRDHVKGVGLYIRLAEAERIAMLQSPEGAERGRSRLEEPGLEEPSEGEVVELYERLLPYAILLGQEDEWSKALAVHYEQADATPGWYSGASGFHAGYFAASMSSFSTSVGASYSGSDASSSGGGAAGGGSSGGGSGGGGGGGV